MVTFFYSFQSEWLKTKRSLAAWLVVIGGFFIPSIMLARHLLYPNQIRTESQTPRFWETLMSQSWQFMSIFLLPMGVILATSLIAQIEFRNNTWKQLHTTPQGFSVIFWSKLSIILLMMFQFFILFNIGIYLSGVVPSFIIKDMDYPQEPFPVGYFLRTSCYFFIDCLPIVALQYLVSIQFRNFFVPLGVGIGTLLAALFAIQWEYGFLVPYTYCSYNFFILRGAKMEMMQTVNIHGLALGYFATFTVMGYVFYLLKKEKG
ncbi:MAG: ABC transporter permease [Spirosomataceae bacterium]